MPVAMKTHLAYGGAIRGAGVKEQVQTFLVLLLLKVANHLPEQGMVLGAQWLRHGGRRCLGGESEGLTCARKESKCAGSGFSESELGRTTGSIR